MLSFGLRLRLSDHSEATEQQRQDPVLKGMAAVIFALGAMGLDYPDCSPFFSSHAQTITTLEPPSRMSGVGLPFGKEVFEGSSDTVTDHPFLRQSACHVTMHQEGP